MLHSLTSRQNAKYSSSSVQKGVIHTLQGEKGTLIVRKTRGGLYFCTSCFLPSQKKQNILEESKNHNWELNRSGRTFRKDRYRSTR